MISSAEYSRTADGIDADRRDANAPFNVLGDILFYDSYTRLIHNRLWWRRSIFVALL
jgi:precorrin-2 methylase